MGKPRLPTTGIRKPRAKDKRVGRKRTPRDEMVAAEYQWRWPTADVHKVGGRFEWCDSEPDEDHGVAVTVENDGTGYAVQLGMERWPDADQAPPLLTPGEAVALAADLNAAADAARYAELECINPATKIGEISRQATVAVDPDDIPMRAGAASFVGMTPREIREQQTEADAIEDHLRSQAVVDRTRAEHDAVPEVQLEDTEPQP